MERRIGELNEYIKRVDALAVVSNAEDRHPHSKDKDNPETYFNYNQGWSDACDHIQSRIEALPTMVRRPPDHGRNEGDGEPVWVVFLDESYCPCWMLLKCGAKQAFFSDAFALGFETYGKLWQAFSVRMEDEPS